jgi:hypothetical protein
MAKESGQGNDGKRMGGEEIWGGDCLRMAGPGCR